MTSQAAGAHEAIAETNRTCMSTLDPAGTAGVPALCTESDRGVSSGSHVVSGIRSRPISTSVAVTVRRCVSLYRRAALRTADHTLAEFSDGIAGIPLQFSPGDAWSYSPAMEVVSRIVEIASGRNIDEYFREDVFTPLKMHATSFYAVPEMEGRIPVSYSRGTDGELRPNAQFLDPEYLTTSRLMSYRVLSTPADYLRFAQMLLNGGELDGERVLSRASVAAMMSNRISPSLTPIVTHVWDHAGYGFGLGGAVLVDSTMSYYPASPGTYRWAGSTGTFFWIDPKLDLIALLWSQTRGIGYSAEHHFQRLVHAAVMP